MLYRIAIYKIVEGKSVFDHYASDNELNYLRVNSAGKVEQYLPNFSRVLSNFNFAPDVAWVDVSETHEVEWGCHLTSDPIYENDIILIHDGDGICYEVRYGVFPLMEFYTDYLVNGSPYCEIEVIGNIHEEEK